MSSEPEIACAIINGISSVRGDEELQDFVVEVEGEEFKCHRLILSACSGFFRGLLMSGMKESLQQRTKIEGVPKESFTAILETIYTGSDNLTRDNMLSVWLAADQLQITIVSDNCVDYITNNICNETVIAVWEISSQIMHRNVIEFCEIFIRNNTSLENWEIIYSTSRKLGSEMILTHVRNFIKKNYDQVSKSKSFLCLHENDLIEIIKSQDLVVSTEDVVIESILNWVNNGSEIISEKMAEYLHDTTSDFLSVEKWEEEEQEQNVEIMAIKPKYSKEYRKKFLESLLSETRLYLVNSFDLEKLSRDTLIMDNNRTRQYLMDAALYKSNVHEHGQWSKAAIHRSCSDLENVGVMCNSDGFLFALSCHPKFTFHNLPKCPFLETCTTVKLIAYMTYFFAIGDFSEDSSLCVFVQNEWQQVKRLSGIRWLGVAVEEFVYLINANNKHFIRFNPRLGIYLFESYIHFPTPDNIEHICSFDLFILVFCSEIIKDVDETAVHCLDTRSQTWTRLDSLEGSAKYMISFRKEKQLYILQSNGRLSEINRDDYKRVNVKFVEVLWYGKNQLYGAICYNGCLYIKGSNRNKIKYQSRSTVFTKFALNYDRVQRSNIVPVILKRSMFS